MMESTNTDTMIKHLQEIFATHGIPRLLVSDNGPQFVAESFKQYCKSCGITHITTAPYHPRSNGKAERLVQTFKTYMDKADPRSVADMEDCVVNFLATYHATPHSVTNQTPSEMLNNTRMRTRLDLLHPCQSTTNKSVLRQKQNYDVHTKPKHF